MPSTACCCIGELTPGSLVVTLVGPSCRVHGDQVTAGAPAQH
jgi:hypothetical protein